MRISDSSMGIVMCAVLVTACGSGDASPDNDAAGAGGIAVGAAGHSGDAVSGGGGEMLAGVGGDGGSAHGTGGALSGGGAGGAAGNGGGKGTGGGAGMAATDGGASSGPCANLPAVGTWEDITPTMSRGLDGTVYNSQGLMLDPFDSRTVWLGTAHPDQKMADARSGVFKSTDCGSTWAHVNTGQNGAALDGSALWSMAIDPVERGVMYTVAAVGALGLFKSTNGGVDWQQLFPAGSEFATHVFANFVGAVMIDATNHRHLVVTSHGACSAPYGSNGSGCQAETLDAGATWTIVPNPAGLGFVENAGAYLIGDDNWIYATPFGSTYRTTDHGKSWKVVGPAIEAGESAHHPLVPAPDGTYYLPSDSGVVQSNDQGASWTLIPNTPGGYGFAMGGGHLYTCPEFNLSFKAAALPHPTTWTSLANPVSRAPNRGSAFLDYDDAHHILYTSNFQGGLFRMVTP